MKPALMDNFANKDGWLFSELYTMILCGLNFAVDNISSKNSSVDFKGPCVQVEFKMPASISISIKCKKIWVAQEITMKSS